MRLAVVVLMLSSLGFASPLRAAQPPVVFADFEGPDYGKWTVEGTAFGAGPARGTLPRQMAVSGFQGKGLVNSFTDGDKSTGALTSPEFKITHRAMTFLIGGGGHAGQTCMNLLVDGQVVRTATGQNTQPGGRELLEEEAWDVSDLIGKTAKLAIVDTATGGWGHILVDQIVFTDVVPPKPVFNPSREVVAQQRWLNLPVSDSAVQRKVRVLVDGQAEREFTIGAASDQPDWWAALDIAAYGGKKLTITVDKLPENSQFLPLIEQGTAPKGRADLYREALRPQLHFSPARGWNNDPNGLAYYKGEYHLFFQHNPYGTKWGNMHWGHAVSKDLLHWNELGEALYPDAMGPMFSGSGVVDARNTSGLGVDGAGPLVLIYTAAGNPTVQGIAASSDGRTFTKFAGNPVIAQITPGNRDPKVIWHAPTRRWVMALYVGFPEPLKPGEKKPGRRDTIHFLTSPDLKQWTVASQIEGFFECPDIFPLAVDGDAQRTKWVLTAANSEYMVGQFDGQAFTPETPKLKGHRGRGFYAAQTFSDLPASDGRRIQIGWLQAPAPGMPFNQAMSVPLELTLVSTAEGPRMTWRPVKELQALRKTSGQAGPTALAAGGELRSDVTGELLEVQFEFTPGDAPTVELEVRGVKIEYDVAQQELVINKHRAAAPLCGGKQRITVLADRNCYEVFASNGLTYVPLPVIPATDNQAVRASVPAGKAQVERLEVHTLRSIWEPAATARR